MGTCGSAPKAPQGPPKESAQSAEARQKSEAATQQITAEIQAAVAPGKKKPGAKKTKAELQAAQKEEQAHKEDDAAQSKEEQERRRKEQEAAEKKRKREEARKAKRDQARKARLDALQAARDMKPPALSEADFNTAIRRLQTVTGENPTDPDRKYTLPEGLEWLTEFLMVLWPSIQKTSELVLEDSVKPQIQGVLNDLPKVASVEIGTFSLGTSVPSFGPISTRRVKAWGLKKLPFDILTPGLSVRMVPEGLKGKGQAERKAYCGNVLRMRTAEQVEGKLRQQYPDGYVDIKWAPEANGGPPEGKVPRAPGDPTPDGLPRESRQSRKWWDGPPKPERRGSLSGSTNTSQRPVAGQEEEWGNPHVEDEGLQLNLSISWRSNMVISIKTNLGEVGIKGLTFNGTIGLWLRPFVPRVPIVGAVEIGFVNPPQVKIDMFGALLSLPGVNDTVHGIIDQQLANAMVLPNRIAVPLDPMLPRSLISHPLPEGILQLTVLRCEKLPSMDLVGKSDPYVVVRVGASTRRTEVINDCSSPKFGGGQGVVMTFPVYDEEQWVWIEVRDDDPTGFDVIGQVHNVPVKQLLVRCMQESAKDPAKGAHEMAIPLTGPDGTNVFDEDDDPAKIVIKAEWRGVDDCDQAEGDALVSVQVEKLRFSRHPGCVPFSKLPKPGTLYCRMTAAGGTLPDGKPDMRPRAPANEDDIGTTNDIRPVTKAAGCDPDTLALFSASELLESIRNHLKADDGAVTAKDMAHMHGFEMFEDGDLTLLEQAIEKTPDKRRFKIMPMAPLHWWQEPEHVQSWVIYRTPEQQKAKKDGKLLATWTLLHHDEPEVAGPAELKKRADWYERLRAYRSWCSAATDKFATYKQTVDPYWGHVLHAYLPTTGKGGEVSEIHLDFIEGPPGKKEKQLGRLVLKKVRDTLQAQAIDVTDVSSSWENACPWDYAITGAKGLIADLGGIPDVSLSRSGVWIRDISGKVPLPASWNTFQAKPPPDWQGQEAMDDYYAQDKSPFKGKRWQAVDWAMRQTRAVGAEEMKRRKEWYDGRKKVVPQSELSKEKADSQEAALQKCLHCGALTWGDYDTLIRKLHGEEDVSTIAETLEWVNMLLAMMWGPIDSYLQDWTAGPLKKFIDATIVEYSGYGLQDVKIAKCSLGTRPLSFGTIQCLKKKAQGGSNEWGGVYDGAVLKLNDILLDSNIDIQIEVHTVVKNITLGAKNIFFRGSVEIELGPMLPKPPCIAGLRVVFPATPDLSLEFSGTVSGLAGLPGVNEMMTQSIQGVLSSQMVPPHYIAVPLDKKLDVAAFTFPEPIGVLQVKVTDAEDILVSDSGGMLRTAGTDAYCRVSIPNHEELRTPVVTVKGKHLCPKWTEQNTMYFVIYNKQQRVLFTLWDQDSSLKGGDEKVGTHYEVRPLVGGNSLIVEGAEVAQLIHKASPQGTKHSLDLRFKVVDEELTDRESAFRGDTFFKLQNYPAHGKPEDGKDEQGREMANRLNVVCRWLTRTAKQTKEVLIGLKASHLTDLPERAACDLGAPYTVRLWVGKNAAQLELGGDVPDEKQYPAILKTKEAGLKPGTEVAPLDLFSDVATTTDKQFSLLSKTTGGNRSPRGRGELLKDEHFMATLLQAVAVKHALTVDTVKDHFEKNAQTWKPDTRCHVRMTFLIRREEPDDEGHYSSGATLRKFKEHCVPLFQAARDPHKPGKVKTQYSDKTATGLQWMMIGFSSTSDPVNMPEGQDCDMAMLTIGFETCKHFVNWLRKDDNDKTLHALISGDGERSPRGAITKQPLTGSFLDCREGGYPIVFTAPMKQHDDLTAGPGAGDFEKHIFSPEMKSKTHKLRTHDIVAPQLAGIMPVSTGTIKEGSPEDDADVGCQYRNNPEVDNSVLVMYVRVQQGKDQQWADFRKRYIRRALRHRGVYSCTVTAEAGDADIHAIKLVCDDYECIDEHVHDISRHTNADFPNDLGMFGAPGGTSEIIGKLKWATVLTPQLAAFLKTSAGDKLDKLPDSTLVCTEKFSPANPTELSGLSVPMEAHKKNLDWGKKAVSERQVNLTHSTPYFNQIVRAAVNVDEAGISGSECPFAAAVVSNDGKKVRVLMKGTLPFNSAGGLSTVSYTVDQEQVFKVKGSAGVMGFGASQDIEGKCHFTGAVSLQMLGDATDV
eukprot:TRINITY_DN55128_c0_g1_i1.p1 TRINITY_DN55128_c0_g1~~TRINITY_DN55128_c0_g1_i1.p1  ORF type:complete len:2173 (+),score=797.88 TRINITY_DN55128_c0_g1_i1:95-6520(+)